MILNYRKYIFSQSIALLAAIGSNAENIEKPNIVYVFADQFRQQSLGFLKQDPVKTPNINAFAKGAVFLQNAASNLPLCSPFRAMLMTGKWPSKNTIKTNCNVKSPFELRDSEVCLSDVLAANGYECGYIGKWHLTRPLKNYPKFNKRPGWDAFTPPRSRHGFNFWYSYGCNDEHLTPHYWTSKADENAANSPKEYSVEHETKIAVKYISNKNGKYRKRKKPFLLFVSYNPPHPPYGLVPQKYKKLYNDKSIDQLLNRYNIPKNKTELKKFAGLWGWPEKNCKTIKNSWLHKRAIWYFAAISAVDQGFGKILNAIKKAGIEKNTIIIFSADHGENLGSQGRMQKGTINTESFSIPFLIQYKGKIKPGTNTLLFNAPDIMPTLLGLAGLNKNIPTQVQGTDYSKLFLGGKMKQPLTQPYIDWGICRGVRSKNYTFHNCYGNKEPVLFDNRKDPYQMNNIAAENPNLVKKFRQAIQCWNEKMLRDK